jgi:hypothetical protein
MRTGICSVAVLMGAIGIVTGAAASTDNGSLAGKNGLSPIIPEARSTWELLDELVAAEGLDSEPA